MALGRYPLQEIKSLPDSMDDQDFQLWIWEVKNSAYECALEPLTQKFWEKQAKSRLAYGILLPTPNIETTDDRLLLVSQKLKEPIKSYFGGLTRHQRYDLYKFIMDMGFPNVEHLKTLHPFTRIAYFQTLESTFQSMILPKRNALGEHWRDSFFGEDPFVPDGIAGITCPSCGKPRRHRRDLTILHLAFLDNGYIKVYSVCEGCEQQFIFDVMPQLLQYV